MARSSYQHIACEPPSVDEDVLVERGIGIDRIELDEGERLPDWRVYELIVAMGGPMSVNDEQEHPWLVDEKRLIREAVRGRHRLLGRLPGRAAAGLEPGRARLRRAQPEVGVLPVTSTDERICRASWRPCSGTATRSTCRRERCGWRSLRPTRTRPCATAGPAYGVQFHLEVKREMARVVGDGAGLRRAGRTQDASGARCCAQVVVRPSAAGRRRSRRPARRSAR